MTTTPDRHEGFFDADDADLLHPGDAGYEQAAEEYARLQEDSYGAPEGSRATTRTGRREAQRAKVASRRRGLRIFTILVVTLAVVLGGGYVAATSLRSLFTGSSESDDYAGPGSGSVTVVVKDGDTSSAIATTLQAAGVVKTARAFTAAARANPASTGIQPGSYVMKSQMKASDALALLLDPTQRDVPKVTIREGLWKSETFAALSKATGVPVANYVAAAKDTAALGLPAAANGNVEGYLFPATYEFPAGATAAQQLQLMVAQAVKTLNSLGVSEATMEKTVIIASIVEAEARREEDRGKIAQVVDNRLADGMRLQLDSTVSYGIQKRALTTSDAERAINNGYGTYAKDGLPVGPIGNPGAASIQAALTPTPGPWLYFVAVDPATGETKFATTAAQHAANVAEFQQWCSDHPGQC